MMAIEMSEPVDAYERIERSLQERQEPGATELCDLVRRMLNGTAGSAQTLDLECLKTGVYRLRIGSGPIRTLVLKCLKPAIAQTDRLVAERWLPALGLGDRCPRLLAGAVVRASQRCSSTRPGHGAGRRTRYAFARRPLAEKRFRDQGRRRRVGSAHRLGSRRRRAVQLRFVDIPLSLPTRRAAVDRAAVSRGGGGCGLASSGGWRAEPAAAYGRNRPLCPLRPLRRHRAAAR